MQQNKKALLSLGMGIAVAFGIDSAQAADESSPKNQTSQQKENKQMGDVKDLQIEDLSVGDGKEAKSGHIVTVHYAGTLTDGTPFDSSHGRQPFRFTLGAGQVIKGWDQGVAGMKVGGKRKLTIPASLAYGNRAVGGVIPANATLVFDVELLGVED